jgi:predicted enzyme related to lactoylglutathione lyase
VITTVLANVDVDDLGRGIDFYCRAFGLRIGRRFGTTGVELLGATFPIYLLEKPAGSAASIASDQRRDYSRHWTPVHLDFVVENIDAAIERATAAGALLEGDVHTDKWGRIAVMADPFGHGFCLIEFLGRGYDEIAN